ncbi:uncharacterized protein LOC114768810 isoform X2 [Denticeps clupeoides]|nr:uncharacterized protein LOC114768810 isoform X2 [Denticeps clupeoides]XP_028816936.1 uncharacterized protein LOC114768810 isoform X2 [Denticeps clupeoides]
MNLTDKRPNKWWTETDTFTMLALIEQLELVHELDKKRQRNDSHFRRLRHSLAKRSIHFSVNQIRNRWKSLKHKYRKIKTASYRSPAARLSAIESFRYFRRLDRMLARRPREGAQAEGMEGGHGHVLLSPSDLEDHSDSEGTQPAAASWQGTLIPKLELNEQEKLCPDETTEGQLGWPPGTDEVMTLGLSGEYLCSVKAEPVPDSSLHDLEDLREPISCRAEGFQGTCEDTSRLILHQLTILNHQLSEQLAEQRSFHCSMLGMMDRQIEVLEQLSNFTRVHQPKPDSMDTSDSSINQKVHDALVHILKSMGHAQAQALQPCLSKTPPSPSNPTPPPSWTLSVVEVHQGSPSTKRTSISENEASKAPDEGSSGQSNDSECPTSPSSSVLVNGIDGTNYGN